MVVKSASEYTVQVGRSSWIEVWNVAEWREMKSWRVPGVRLACAVSPDGRWSATGHRYGPVQLWNLSDRSETNWVSFPAGTITDLEFSPDDRFLAASNEEGTIKVWDTHTFREWPELRAHLGAVNTLAFTQDGRRLATAGDGEEAVKLWDVATWQELITLERAGERLRQIAFSADGGQLTARNSQGDILLWRVPSFAEIRHERIRLVGWSMRERGWVLPMSRERAQRPADGAARVSKRPNRSYGHKRFGCLAQLSPLVPELRLWKQRNEHDSAKLKGTKL